MPDLPTDAGVAEEHREEAIAPGAVLLRGFALPFVDNVLAVLSDITAQAPFRHMTTPWGAAMSVAMTNCGEAGWLTDRTGYRYDRVDSETGQPWPVMPECFRELASRAADRAGYPGFVPDACLINRYAPGTRLNLHQDRDERDYAHPIVSVSLVYRPGSSSAGRSVAILCGASWCGMAMRWCGAVCRGSPITAWPS